MSATTIVFLSLLVLHVVLFVVNECTTEDEHMATRETIWMCFFAIMLYLTYHLG